MRIDLEPDHRGRRWVMLRPLTGRDELAIDPSCPGEGTRLVERLLMTAPGAAADASRVATLTVSERDRLLAAIYQACFGDRVACVASCEGCGERFEFSFLLAALLAHQRQSVSSEARGPDASGFYELPNGARFRLPTLDDLGAVAGLPPERAVALLRQRCVEGEVDREAEPIQEAMAHLAPVLDLDVDTSCPACGRRQGVRFSMEAFLLRALAAERRYLTREVHRLARAYGWSLDDILSLSRDDRRTLVRHVEGEAAREWAS